MDYKFEKLFLKSFKKSLKSLDEAELLGMVEILSDIKNNGGRIFFIGNGGSAANCSHAVNDFRKITNIECYSISDNVAELTARTNDEGFDTVFVEWLKTSKLNTNDALFVLSVGGGNKERSISTNIVKAIDYAIEKNATIFGIVGKDGGYTFEKGYAVINVATYEDSLITPVVESMQSLILHYIVSHPRIKENQTKWEGTDEQTFLLDIIENEFKK